MDKEKGKVVDEAHLELERSFRQYSSNPDGTERSEMIREAQLVFQRKMMEKASRLAIEQGEGDFIFTYSKDEILGCKHYERKCKLKCPKCDRFSTCRMCHEEEYGHEMDRFGVKEMFCMNCESIVEVGKYCSKCEDQMAPYYCDVCHLFANPGAEKRFFHCEKCGLCRVEPVGTKVFHCDKCGVCVFDTHECKEGAAEMYKESVCVACGENLFGTTMPVLFGKCGHGFHENCFHQHVNASLTQDSLPTCPICRKTLVSLEQWDTRVDMFLEREANSLAEYRHRTSDIHCNECGTDSTVAWHYAYWKCPNCNHYNTCLR